jgi:protein tyrosine/serine phosphatase
VNKLLIRPLLLFVLTCLTTIAFPFAGKADPPPTDIPNFHTVAPGIYRGAAPTVAGLTDLKAMGVKTIIDLRISPKLVKIEKAEAKAQGFKWINLPMGSDPPTAKEVATFISTLQQAPSQPVFVHCQHGADRTGCMIGIWRETQQNWPYKQTFEEMRKYGFQTRWVKLSAAVKQRAKS